MGLLFADVGKEQVLRRFLHFVNFFPRPNSPVACVPRPAL